MEPKNEVVMVVSVIVGSMLCPHRVVDKLVAACPARYVVLASV
jgi:hypothetical protein